MSDNYKKSTANNGKKRDLSAFIADEIRDAIINGRLIVDERLPSESDLAAQFSVSRPTVREALKRLAAQSLIRTQRGASGGAFVNRLKYEQAYDQHVTTSTLLLSMNAIRFDTACEARFALERSCAPLASQRCTDIQLAQMQDEIDKQSSTDLSDEAFCASDVAFHRLFVNCAHNPVLSYQLAGAVEAMQPLMNMITYTRRSREVIIALHQRMQTALARRCHTEVEHALDELYEYTISLTGTQT